MKVFVQDIFGNMFGQDVGHVFCSQHFMDREVAGPDPILDPQIGSGKVPDPAQATPSANPHRRRRVSVKGDGPCKAEILRD